MGFDDPSFTVFVKNIETRVTEEILFELFLQAGPLKNVKIPMDRATGDKRNFAFVTYRDEISVPYACELFNQMRLFKRPIYCNPSKAPSKGSFNQTPQSTPGSSSTPQSPTSSNNSLIQGILNRSNSVPTPLTSTPFHGKRKISVDPDSRVIIIDDSSDSDRDRYSQHDDRDRHMYRDSPGGRNSSGRGRYDERGDDTSFHSDEQRRFNDRSSMNDRSSSQGMNDRSSQGSRYDRSNSYNSSYGNTSPMHVHALNQSHKQYGRQGSSPRGDGGGGGSSPRGGGGGDFNRSPRGGGDSSFGPMRQDSSHKNARRQRSQPY